MLGSLVRLFRVRGFAGVSVRELEAASGVHATSLYKAYGNKEGLFAAALLAYNEKVVRGRIREHLESDGSPLAGIRSYFASLLRPEIDDDPGCLLTNSAVECYALEASARAEVAAGLNAIRSALERALERAQRRGEVRSSLVPSEAALQLLALYQGVLVLVRFGMSAGALAKLVDGALSQLVQPIDTKKR